MQQQDHYYTIAKPAVAEFKDRGSKFLAYAHPLGSVDEFKFYLRNIKKEHPKAVHHCFAYRFGTDGNVFRVNDDGEPSGTAGKPILGQVDSKNLTNVAIVVVRYFGGTLLGVPGLINAYKSAASMALQTTPVIQKLVCVLYELLFDYTQLNDVMRILKQYYCIIVEEQIQIFCVIKANIPIRYENEVLYKLKRLQNAETRKIV